MVNDAKTFELVNRGIDGELSARQTARLTKLRAENQDIETLYIETAAVADRVQSLGSVSPPDDLKSRIMRSLPSQHRPVSVRQTVRQGYLAGLMERVQFVLRAQPALQLATVFIGGLLLGGLLMIVGPLSGGIAPSDVMGTIGADTPGQTPSETAAASFDDQVFSGTAKLVRTGERVSLSLEGAAATPVTLEIAVSPEQVVLAGFANRFSNSASDPQMEISSSAGRVALLLSGDVTVTLDYASTRASTRASSRATSAEFTINVVRADAVIASRTLSI